MKSNVHFRSILAFLIIFISLSILPKDLKAVSMNAQFVVDTNNGSKLVVRVQIEASVSQKLGDANFILTFNTTNLSYAASPDSGHDFHFYNFDITNSSSAWYDEGTVVQSPTGTLSINVVFLGNTTSHPGQAVTTGWIDLCKLSFTTIHSAGQGDLAWAMNTVGSSLTDVFQDNQSTHFTLGTFTGNTVNPLPVSLTDFTAVLEQGATRLNWTTASEINNDYFEIQRTTDAATWTAIGQVPGHGTSNVLNNYSDIDNLEGVIPSGTIYYRLKQVDFNGEFKYSMIRSVELTSAGLSVYPNPTNNIINVNWINYTEDNTTLRLVNTRGINVYQQNVTGKGKLQKQIDMSLLPSGIYYLQIISDSNIVSQAVTKD